MNASKTNAEIYYFFTTPKEMSSAKNSVTAVATSINDVNASNPPKFTPGNFSKTNNAANSFTPGSEIACNAPKPSRCDTASIPSSHLFSGNFDAGTKSFFRTTHGSTSHASTCFTTLFASSKTCVVFPLAANFGRHGKASTTAENFQ